MSPQPNHQDSAAALRSAISEGDVETVLNLLDSGADVNARIVIDDIYGGSETAPLQHAVSEGQLEIVELLLNRGADVDSYAGGRTPLQKAVYSGQPEIVHALLNSGADIDFDDGDGEPPLYLALTDGVGGEIVLALLEGGAEITDEVMNYLSERSSLYEAFAAGMNYEEYLDLELRGGRIEYSDSYMETEGVGDFSLVAYIRTALLDSGASSDLNARDESGASPLHRAASAGETELVIAWLSIESATIDARDNNYQTPLHKAVAHGHTETAVALLQRGANPKARAKDGNIPLSLAVLAGDGETVVALLEGGANAEVRANDGYTLLHAAEELEDGGTAEILLDRGADISARNNEGLTPLHVSMLNGRSATAQLLIDRGADISAEDDFGKTPLDYAFEFEYVDEEADPDSEDDDE